VYVRRRGRVDHAARPQPASQYRTASTAPSSARSSRTSGLRPHRRPARCYRGQDGLTHRRQARDRYGFEDALFSSDGDAIARSERALALAGASWRRHRARSGGPDIAPSASSKARTPRCRRGRRADATRRGGPLVASRPAPGSISA
jgi:hypothetical protein